ncbi:MAG: hypothetical protein BWY96_03046 [Spirochaetes bacterium ADurb.BinA120]|nr:MAG: hypothetical protein BWY96_03046 [Spirochaetes bacterium ADurb.BinA120]
MIDIARNYMLVSPHAQLLSYQPKIVQLFGGRKRVPQPFPRFEFCFKPVPAHNQRQGLPGIAPPAADIVSKYRFASAGEGMEQVPGLDGMHLDRRRRCEQHALRFTRQLVYKPQHVVGLRRLPFLGRADIAAARPVSLVDDDAFVLHAEQGVFHGRAMCNKPLGYNADSPRAAFDIVVRRGGMGYPLLVHPGAPRPHGRGHVQKRVQLLLPLEEQGLRGKHQHGPLADEGHKLGGESELDGLAKAHLIGKNKTRAAVFMRVIRQAYEILLVLPQPQLLPVNRRLYHR